MAAAVEERELQEAIALAACLSMTDVADVADDDAMFAQARVS